MLIVLIPSNHNRYLLTIAMFLSSELYKRATRKCPLTALCTTSVLLISRINTDVVPHTPAFLVLSTVSLSCIRHRYLYTRLARDRIKIPEPVKTLAPSLSPYLTIISTYFSYISLFPICRLCQKLSDMLRSTINISLKPKSRDKIIQFISEVSEAIGQFENYYKEIPDTPEELEAMYPPVGIHKNSDVG